MHPVVSDNVLCPAPCVLSHVALKPLVKKQLSAWRPITARLILLKKLVGEFGLEGGSGLAADNIMSFIQVSGKAIFVFVPVNRTRPVM